MMMMKKNGENNTSGADIRPGADTHQVADAARAAAPARVGETDFSAAQVLTATSPSDDRGDRLRPFDWSLTMRVGKQMSRYPALFWTIIALAVVLALLNAAIPMFFADAIGGAIGQNTSGWRQHIPLSPNGWIWAGVGIITSLAVIWYWVMRIRQWCVNDMAERVVRDLRQDIYLHLQSLGMNFYDTTKVGRILARSTSDIDALRSAISQVAPRTTIAVVQMFFALIVMLTYDWVLGLTVVVGAPAIYLVNWKFRERLSSAYRLVQETYSLLTANLAESIAGIRVTQAFAREERNAQMFGSLCDLHRSRHMVVARYQGLYRPLMDITSQLFIAIGIYVGGWRIIAGHLTVPDVLGFMLMTGVFFQPILVIGDMLNVTLQALAGAERVFRLLDTRPVQLDPGDADQIIPLTRRSAGMRVEFRQVSFGYRKDRPILHDITFSAEPGQTIALVGHTGSGKTSIINLAAKFYPHDAGEIFIDGIDIRRITQADLHAQTGIVQQENFLFTGSIIDNIRFPRPDASDDEVRRVCEQLDCMDIFDQLPDGLYTQAGERGGNLSLGQRQLACFARAMMAQPRLLILDEATSAVDTVSEDQVHQSLRRLIRGRTSFVVAHRLSTIREADRILVIDKGRIVESGAHDELLATGRVYRELYEEFIRLSRAAETPPPPTPG